jgi:hypothetical protein
MPLFWNTRAGSRQVRKCKPLSEKFGAVKYCFDWNFGKYLIYSKNRKKLTLIVLPSGLVTTWPSLFVKTRSM